METSCPVFVRGFPSHGSFATGLGTTFALKPFFLLKEPDVGVLRKERPTQQVHMSQRITADLIAHGEEPDPLFSRILAHKLQRLRSQCVQASSSLDALIRAPASSSSGHLIRICHRPPERGWLPLHQQSHPISSCTVTTVSSYHPHAHHVGVCEWHHGPDIKKVIITDLYDHTYWIYQGKLRPIPLHYLILRHFSSFPTTTHPWRMNHLPPAQGPPSSILQGILVYF